MAKYLFLALFSVGVSTGQAVEVYQCIDNGSLLLSDKPCSKEAQQQTTIHIQDLSPVTASAETVSSIAVMPDKVIRQKLIGQWHWMAKFGNEDRTFYADGRFESYGKSEFAEIRGAGSWSLYGNKLTITATFENTMYNGEKVTVDNILEYTVKSIDDRAMSLYWPRYGSSEEWIRQ